MSTSKAATQLSPRPERKSNPKVPRWVWVGGGVVALLVGTRLWIQTSRRRYKKARQGSMTYYPGMVHDATVGKSLALGYDSRAFDDISAVVKGGDIPFPADLKIHVQPTDGMKKKGFVLRRRYYMLQARKPGVYTVEARRNGKMVKSDIGTPLRWIFEISENS